MSNEVKYIDVKTTHTTSSMILSIQKILIEMILKQMKRHTKKFSFFILDM